MYLGSTKTNVISSSLLINEVKDFEKYLIYRWLSMRRVIVTDRGDMAIHIPTPQSEGKLE